MVWRRTSYTTKVVLTTKVLFAPRFAFSSFIPPWLRQHPIYMRPARMDNASMLCALSSSIFSVGSKGRSRRGITAEFLQKLFMRFCHLLIPVERGLFSRHSEGSFATNPNCDRKYAIDWRSEAEGRVNVDDTTCRQDGRIVGNYFRCCRQ
jgi:hypothetical protein